MRRSGPRRSRGVDGSIQPSLSIKALRGKIVLIDFWDYTCVNCIRTLPYLKAWHERYAEKGLVLIGVHSPEFPFAREASQVERAIKFVRPHLPDRDG
ncbi:MAG: redoxin domain-containing protein [Candidatus Manganitrophus sp.]|nr:redoxin domain-containing protein [Candidatus Manganitrophus sp.]